MTKLKYTERETRLIVSYCMITFAFTMFVNWSIANLNAYRPAYIIDLLFPMVMTVTGAYILKYKIPEK